MRFSLERYRWLLGRFRTTGRVFSTFASPLRHSIILRSDIDYDPAFAVDIARANAEANISAIFFVLVSGPFYSIFDTKTHADLRRIIEAGQRIGLHFHNPYPVLDSERMNREFQALQLVVPTAEKIVAWHNPGESLDVINKAAREHGFISTYEPGFFGPGRYTSDSNCARDAETIAKAAISDADIVQVLCHPLIWNIGGDNMLEVLDAYLALRCDSLNKTLAEQNSVWATRRA